MSRNRLNNTVSHHCMFGFRALVGAAPEPFLVQDSRLMAPSFRAVVQTIRWILRLRRRAWSTAFRALAWQRITTPENIQQQLVLYTVLLARYGALGYRSWPLPDLPEPGVDSDDETGVEFGSEHLLDSDSDRSSN